MLHILSILTDHIATIQLATIKSQSNWCVHYQKEHKKERDLRKLSQSVLPSTDHTPTANISFA